MSDKLYGLVLVGGKSKRMNRDKGQINYNGKSQTARAVELLEQVCEKVFVSCREDQQKEEHLSPFSQIHDLLGDVGPLGGIVSAQKTYPDTSFLVLACDLPYLSSETLQNLVNERDKSKIATCYENTEKKWAEPLCTIYESHSYKLLNDSLEQDIRCPRKIVSNADTKRLTIPTVDGKNPLDNINTPEEYQVALMRIEEAKHAN